MNKILRAPWHDYTQRSIYMITINKSPISEYFGIIEGDYRLPAGQQGSPFIRASKTGCAIKEVLRRFYLIEPNIRILQYALMPDHVHVLLFVEKPTNEILGRIVARFKVEVNKAVGFTQVFAKGFNDQILKTTRSLNTLYNYIRQNPYRLAVRRAHPDFFRRINRLKIGDRYYQAYGNIHLMDNPFKEQVIIHRNDTPETLKYNRELWLYTAANRGVLVSPFISPVEKAIRAEAEEAGSRFILIINEPMPERYKPSGHNFDLCKSGRMLIISANLPGSLSRQTCLAMNSLAEVVGELTMG